LIADSRPKKKENRVMNIKRDDGPPKSSSTGEPR
jgi:hypothetical protein